MCGTNLFHDVLQLQEKIDSDLLRQSSNNLPADFSFCLQVTDDHSFKRDFFLETFTRLLFAITTLISWCDRIERCGWETTFRLLLSSMQSGES